MIKAILNQKNNSWKKAVWFGWSWVLPGVVLAVIVLKLSGDANGVNMLSSARVVHVAGIVLCALLLSFNIGLEARKWQFILKPIEHKSLFECIKIILAGKSLNVVSPFGLGDGFSRYSGLSPENKKQIFVGLALDRFSQLMPTLCFGLLSTYYLIERGLDVPISNMILVIALMAACLFGLSAALYIYRKSIWQYLKLFQSLDLKSISVITMLSFARYFVFVVQFYLIFWAFGSQLPVHTVLLGIAWIFLIKTMVPNMSVLGDLMKRELSATLFFSFFISDLSVVLLASFLVWVINIVLPAVLGLFFVSDIKKSF